ncbi:Hypothetical_protein [Hexamita inflata]|uniref:Hypothetical_protein n=1 Tax=Hexamita inflata TaxID=28002 RepID=A0AA86QXR0_9EUKA|nr:Hypothetical protein HINF_LOCUS47095 [Hexamita inflata]
MSWWTTKTHTEDTQKIKKQQLYPRTLLMYMNGANLLKQEKLFREQNLARTHQTDRSSFITFTLAPSPGRYTQQRQVTNASAFASKSERKIQLQQSNDMTIPARIHTRIFNSYIRDNRLKCADQPCTEMIDLLIRKQDHNSPQDKQRICIKQQIKAQLTTH